MAHKLLAHRKTVCDHVGKFASPSRQWWQVTASSCEIQVGSPCGTQQSNSSEDLIRVRYCRADGCCRRGDAIGSHLDRLKLWFRKGSGPGRKLNSSCRRPVEASHDQLQGRRRGVSVVKGGDQGGHERSASWFKTLNDRVRNHSLPRIRNVPGPHRCVRPRRRPNRL